MKQVNEDSDARQREGRQEPKHGRKEIVVYFGGHHGWARRYNACSTAVRCCTSATPSQGALSNEPGPDCGQVPGTPVWAKVFVELTPGPCTTVFNQSAAMRLDGRVSDVFPIGSHPVLEICRGIRTWVVLV